MLPTVARVGFLWDSLSENTGDQAIGSTLLRLAARAGVSALEPFEIGRHRWRDFGCLVIGGGELLTAPGDPYYDLFRPPGEHVLNTVGTGAAIEASYLDSYRLVSVRSQADRESLHGLQREVRVAPCLTVLFDEVAVEREADASCHGRLGLQLQPAAIVPSELAGTLAVLRQLGETCFVPFTHYNGDRELQRALADAAGLAAPLTIDDPDAAFAAIRRLSGIVTSSLHATIMAYVAGVPFLAIPYASKVERFVRERGLAHRLLSDLAALPAQQELLRGESVDWAAQLAADQAAARSLVEEIFAEVERAQASPRAHGASGAGEPRGTVAEPESAHAVAAHRLTIGRHAEYGTRIADAVRSESQRLGVAAYCRGLEGQLASVDRELQAAGGYARSLEGRVESLSSELAIHRRPRVVAVVVHHRGVELLDQCLAALQASRGVELQTVVVANACDEPLPGRVAASPDVHLVESAAALGFSVANNLGVEWARANLPPAEHYFFANNDLLVEPDTLIALVEELTAWPHGGVAGPTLRIWGAEHVLNSLGLNVTTTGEAWDEGIGVELAQYGPLPPTREVLAVTGSAILVRAELLGQVGGWSPIYGYYMEDIDLCLRAWSAGWRVVQSASSRAVHAISATSDEVPDLKLLSSWRNRFVLMLAHWPLRRLLREALSLVPRELGIYLRRRRHGFHREAKLQARAWAGALRRLPAAWASRRGRRDTGWVRFLRPHGSVPVIRLPARSLAPRGSESASTGAAGASAGSTPTVRGTAWNEAPAVEARYRRKATGRKDGMHWLRYVVDHHLDARAHARMLFPGCGAGVLERDVLAQMRHATADAYDVSLSALAAARAAAAAQGLDRVRYFAADSNSLLLPAATYDAIWFHNSLHHVAALEHVLDQARAALRPGGVLICVEYVGANAFDFPPRQKAAIVEAFSYIPERLRRNLSGSGPPTISAVGIPDPAEVRRADPSESVRSSEILALIAERFDVVQQRDLGGSLLQYALNNIAGNFSPDDPEANAVLARIFALEDRLVERGELGSDFVFLVATPRSDKLPAGATPSPQTRAPAR